METYTTDAEEGIEMFFPFTLICYAISFALPDNQSSVVDMLHVQTAMPKANPLHVHVDTWIAKTIGIHREGQMIHVAKQLSR